MVLDSQALALTLSAAALFALGPACSGTTNVHDTDEARSKACYDCHSTAYNVVKNPVHVGVFPTTCGRCHSTNAWIPASGGHPEASFPITTGSHGNKGIACGDCHIASLGSDVAGQNTDCTHCHLGAHNTPAVDSIHAGIAGYPGDTSTLHSCLGCHPTG